MIKKKYEEFGSRYILWNFLALLISLPILWTILGINDFFLSFCVGGFSLLISALISWDKSRLKNFRCPQCRKVIGQATVKDRESGKRVNHYCVHCDIEWETGSSKANSQSSD
jgi:hypothetical protein